jgi:RNA polymerase sigma-70 factor (ECF subfamily)
MNNREVDVNSTLSDNEIIVRILQGEKDLYAIIVRRYNQRLYRVGMSIINDDAEVEDVMQVAYINAYENLGKFANKASFSTWLTRILINESFLRLKKRKRSALLNDDIIGRKIALHQITEVKTPDAMTQNSELKTILEEVIRRLPEKYRTVFIMREIEGLNITDTGECLDITEVNVKVRLNRAKALLKESLSTYYKRDEILQFHLSRCNRMVDRVLNGIEAL